MRFRNFSLGLVLLSIFVAALAGCSNSSIATGCSGNKTECQIVPTPTPKELSTVFKFSNGHPDGQDEEIIITGVHYTNNVPIQVSLQAVPDTQGALHTYGYHATSGLSVGWFQVVVAFNCPPSGNISQDMVTIIGLETDDYTSATTLVPLRNFCGDQRVPTDFLFLSGT